MSAWQGSRPVKRNEFVQYSRYDKLSNEKIYLQSKLFNFFVHISRYNSPRKAFEYSKVPSDTLVF